MEKLTEAARELRRAMDRERYRKNPELQRNRNIRYLNRKAERLAAERLNAEKADAASIDECIETDDSKNGGQHDGK